MGNTEIKWLTEELSQMKAALESNDLNKSHRNVRCREVNDLETPLQSLYDVLDSLSSSEHPSGQSAMVSPLPLANLFRNVFFSVLKNMLIFQMKITNQQTTLDKNIKLKANQEDLIKLQNELEREQTKNKKIQVMLENHLKLKVDQEVFEAFQNKVNEEQANINKKQHIWEKHHKELADQEGVATLKNDPERVQADVNKKQTMLRSGENSSPNGDHFDHEAIPSLLRTGQAKRNVREISNFQSNTYQNPQHAPKNCNGMQVKQREQLQQCSSFSIQSNSRIEAINAKYESLPKLQENTQVENPDLRGAHTYNEVNENQTMSRDNLSSYGNHLDHEPIQNPLRTGQAEMKESEISNFQSNKNQIQNPQHAPKSCNGMQVKQRKQLEQSSSFSIQGNSRIEANNAIYESLPKQQENTQVENPDLKGAQAVDSKRKIVVCIMSKKSSYLEASRQCIRCFAEKWNIACKIVTRRIGALYVKTSDFTDADFVILVAVPEPRGLILSEKEQSQLFAAYRTALQLKLEIMVMMCIQSRTSDFDSSAILHQSCYRYFHSQPLLEKLYEKGQLTSVRYEDYQERPMTLNKSQELFLYDWLHKNDSKSSYHLKEHKHSMKKIDLHLDVDRGNTENLAFVTKSAGNSYQTFHNKIGKSSSDLLSSLSAKARRRSYSGDSTQRTTGTGSLSGLYPDESKIETGCVVSLNSNGSEVSRENRASRGSSARY